MDLSFIRSYRATNNLVLPTGYTNNLNLFDDGLCKPPKGTANILIGLICEAYASLIASPTVFFKIDGSVRVVSDFAFNAQNTNTAGITFELNKFNQCLHPLVYGQRAFIPCAIKYYFNIDITTVQQISTVITLTVAREKFTVKSK